MKTLREWKCYRCAAVVWSTAKHDPTRLINRVPLCPTCRVPSMKMTGTTRQVPVMRDIRKLL